MARLRVCILTLQWLKQIFWGKKSSDPFFFGVVNHEYYMALAAILWVTSGIPSGIALEKHSCTLIAPTLKVISAHGLLVRETQRKLHLYVQCSNYSTNTLRHENKIKIQIENLGPQRKWKMVIDWVQVSLNMCVLGSELCSEFLLLNIQKESVPVLKLFHCREKSNGIRLQIMAQCWKTPSVANDLTCMTHIWVLMKERNSIWRWSCRRHRPALPQNND